VALLRFPAARPEPQSLAAWHKAVAGNGVNHGLMFVYGYISVLIIEKSSKIPLSGIENAR